jgi:hypothetical protein
MGHWGTGISSNDTYMEVYETFFHYYNHNVSIEDIKQQLAKDFDSVISEELTCNDYWFAYSKALWECKALDTETYNKVKTIIENQNDLKVWESLGASRKDILSRKAKLEKFLSDISVEKDQPKARKKITYYSGYYEKGTCLTFRMGNGCYGGLVVVEQELNTETGKNFVLATDICKDSLPELDDFLNSKVLTARHTDSLGYFREYFLKLVFESKYKRHNKDIDTQYIKIGVLPVQKIDLEAFNNGTHYCDRWWHWINEIETFITRIKNGEKEKISSTVKDWIGYNDK